MSFNQHLSNLQDPSLSQGVSPAFCSMQIQSANQHNKCTPQHTPASGMAPCLIIISTRMNAHNSIQRDARLPKVTLPGKNWTLDNALASLRMHVAYLPEMQSRSSIQQDIDEAIINAAQWSQVCNTKSYYECRISHLIFCCNVLSFDIFALVKRDSLMQIGTRITLIYLTVWQKCSNDI